MFSPSSTPPADASELNQARKTITTLREQLRKLSDELKSKSALLSSFMDTAVGQSRTISALQASLMGDTLPWNPTSPQPTSTPQAQRSWTEVVRGGRKPPHHDAPPALVALSSRYDALSEPGSPPPAWSAASVEEFPNLAKRIPPPAAGGTRAAPDAGQKSASPSGSNRSSPPTPPAPANGEQAANPRLTANGQEDANKRSTARRKLLDEAPAPPATAKEEQAACQRLAATGQPDANQRSAARRRLLREAVRRNSAGRAQNTEKPVSPPTTHQPPPERPSPSNSNNKNNRQPETHQHRPKPAASPRPLFPPTTLIIGSSITRKIRFFNALTRCFPGATVQSILTRLPDILESLPPSIHRIIVHVGSIDASRRQSEITKASFTALFHLLKSTGKTIFISGPLAPLSGGYALFSRILSLHAWLQTACYSHRLHFIANFDLFWNRSSFFKQDGLHPNMLGSRILAANIQHTVQNAVDIEPPKS